MKFKRIVITGFMGAGKTTVGKLVAKKLQWLFFDTDALAESTEGISVSDIFERKGEDYFRKLEKRCLEGLVSMNEVVITTGGGTLLSAENLSLASQDSAVICLTASEEELKKRLSKDKSRPLLNAGFDAALDLLKERDSRYKKMGLQVDTTGLTPEEVSEKIIGLLSVDAE